MQLISLNLNTHLIKPVLIISSSIAVLRYCGIALRSGKDAALVSSSDKAELNTVRDGFAKKKLDLGIDAADDGVKKVCEEMKGVQQKSRVTFYYLLAQATDTMDKISSSVILMLSLLFRH
jgi:hypothetical protein